MDTINIINNFDLKILMENILIINQSKLLDLIIEIFESGYLSDKKLNEEIVSEYFDKQKFIDWNLFLNLINLNTTSYSHKTKSKINPLSYIVKAKSIRLVEFLLDLTLKNYEIEINWSGVFVDIIKQMYMSDSIINKLIDLSLIDNKYKELLNKQIYGNKTTLFYIVSKCSESIILRLVETNLIHWDWVDDYSNGLVHWACKRNLTQLFDSTIKNNLDLDKTNKGGKTPLHLACIKNNIGIVKLLIKENVSLEIIDLQSNSPINYAIKYGNSELVKLLLYQDINLDFNDSEIFYQLIKYQNEEIIEDFINSNLFDINKTSWIWTTLMLGNNFLFSQIIIYSKKKLFSLIINYFTNMHKYYDGHYIGDMFDNDDTNLM